MSEVRDFQPKPRMSPTNPHRDIQPASEYPRRYVDMSDVMPGSPSTGRVAPIVRLVSDGDNYLPVTRVHVDKSDMDERAEKLRKRLEREQWEVMTVLRSMGFVGELSDVPVSLYASTCRMIKAQRGNRRNEARKS